jgi:hypothetical protein
MSRALLNGDPTRLDEATLDHVHQLLRLEYEIAIILGCLTLVSQGQPARATELVLLCHANGRDKSLRAILMEQGLLATYLRHSKDHSSRWPPIPRTLSKPVSDLTLMYLAVIRPVTEFLTKRFNLPGKDVVGMYYFNSATLPNPLTGAKLCDRIQNFFRAFAQANTALSRFSIRSWRQGTIIGWYHIGESRRLFERTAVRRNPRGGNCQAIF